MTRTREIDVLIVGLGPAGSRAAAAAASEGCRVLAMDRRQRAGHPVQCAEFVPILLGQELDGLGAFSHQSIAEMVTFVEKQAPDVKEDFPGHMIDRRRFDGALVTAAKDAGAECRFGACVDSIAGDGIVRLTSGESIRPRVIIGADGPRSRAGGAVGRTNADVVETRQITVPLLAAHSATDIFLSADIVGGYGWLFPKGDFANLGVGVVPEAKNRLKPLLEALHRSLVQDRRVGAEVSSHTGGPIPVGGMLNPVAVLGETLVLLAGDAAGLTNPITGAGIASAVISGGLAGEAAAGWIEGNEDAPADYADELESLLKPALDRALRRRRGLLAEYDEDAQPAAEQLRRGWIAYPEYWAA